MSTREKILDRLPDILPREADSIFRRYVEAHEEEVEQFEDDLDAIKLTRQIDNSSGDNLDRIGAIFGTAGQRLGRTDEAYRSYLKSVVQAFSGRGTDMSMRMALAAAFDVTVDDIKLEENTTDVEYTVILYDWPTHSVDSLYELTDLVSPSGVSQNGVRYVLDPDTSLSFDDADVYDNDRHSQESSVSNVTTFQEITLGPEADEQIVQEEQQTHVEQETASSFRWDAANWDQFRWDGRFGGEAMQATVDVDVTVEDV